VQRRRAEKSGNKVLISDHDYDEQPGVTEYCGEKEKQVAL